MSVRILAACVLLSGCAHNHEIDAAERAQDARYNRCVDRIHEMRHAGDVFNWSREIDACMGKRDPEAADYPGTKLPTREQWEQMQ